MPAPGTADPTSSEVTSFSATASTSVSGGLDIALTGIILPVYGVANDVAEVEIVQPANFGVLDTYGNVLGTYPADMATTLCPIVRTMGDPTAITPNEPFTSLYVYHDNRDADVSDLDFYPRFV